MSWEPVIGLEVHLQLSTMSKLFSGSATEYGAMPNTQASYIDVALPGTLPLLNGAALKLAVAFGLSVDATIARHCEFDRKNYFYPDLPKAYQITQFYHPIVSGGYLNIEHPAGHIKKIGLTRAHLEEDAGKSIHEGLDHHSGIDLNRAGIPLLEIVSEPDMRSPEEAVAYLKTLHTLVRYLKISDANMQEGSFRCDVNISLRQQGHIAFGTRVELKNINSFRFVEKALRYEITRQTHILDHGGTVQQETRLYDADRHETRSMRRKEVEVEYRYFPDPDLLPIQLSDDDINAIKAKLPERPQEKRARFEAQYQLNRYDASLLTQDIELADYFEQVVHAAPEVSPKLAANWMNGELAAALNKAHRTINDSPITPEQLAALLLRLADHTLSSKTAKLVFEALWQREGSTDAIIEAHGLKQMTDNGLLSTIIDDVIGRFPDQVEKYRSGQDKLLAFFVGQVMKASQGKANPQQVNTLLKQKLAA